MSYGDELTIILLTSTVLYLVSMTILYFMSHKSLHKALEMSHVYRQNNYNKYMEDMASYRKEAVIASVVSLVLAFVAGLHVYVITDSLFMLIVAFFVTAIRVVFVVKDFDTLEQNAIDGKRSQDLDKWYQQAEEQDTRNYINRLKEQVEELSMEP